jgi:hypothetical protein
MAHTNRSCTCVLEGKDENSYQESSAEADHFLSKRAVPGGCPTLVLISGARLAHTKQWVLDTSRSLGETDRFVPPPFSSSGIATSRPPTLKGGWPTLWRRPLFNED